MEIHLCGTREDCTDLAAVLPDLLGDVAEITRISGFYPDHGDHAPGDAGRVYVHLNPCPSPTALTQRTTVRTTTGRAAGRASGHGTRSRRTA